MNQSIVGPISPFFIVKNAVASADYYVTHLGFELRALLPDKSPFFAIVGRGNAQLLLKAISDNVQAQPNPTRHEWAPWDAFVFAGQPQQLYDEFESRGALLQKGVHVREDGLVGCEVRDLDGYVLFFGHPE